VTSQGRGKTAHSAGRKGGGTDGDLVSRPPRPARLRCDTLSLMPAASPDEGDTTFALDGTRKPLEVQRFRLIVTEGPDRGKEHVSTSARVSVGSH
jgi:hypothetical protein